MRARLVACSSVVLLFACTRDNPAFDTGPGETADELGESVGEAGTEVGETGPSPICPLQGGTPLTIKMPGGCGENTPGDLYREDWLLDPVINGSDITGTWCTAPGCTACEVEVPYPVDLNPLNLEALSFEGNCVRIMAAREPDSTSCNYHTVALWNDGDAEPVLVASRSPDVGLPPIDGSIAQFAPAPDLVQSCACEDYWDHCCEGTTNPPSLYRLQIGEAEYVDIGGTQSMAFDGLTYIFHALDAFDPGGCESTGANMTWALTR